ncbi:MAG: peptide chain release factor N(5)-glutamine methyltransferase [Candidatus Paceibacterota bacterium]
MTIKEALKSATDRLRSSNSPSAYLDAEVLLLHALRRKKDVRDKSWVYINSNYDLSRKEEASFFGFISRRCLHEPVAYIIEKKEFYGYDFYVNENALIPRPETEMIVSEVLETIRSKKECGCKFDLLDIGTGSGCIIISVLNELAKTHRQKLVHSAIANDISKKAIEVAERNSRKYRLNKKIRFICEDFSDMLRDKDLIDRSRRLIITANLPYIRTDGYDRLLSSVKYEPRSALVGGKDGLKFITKLINNVAKLKKNANSDIIMFIESDPEQINIIKKLARGSLPDSESVILKDLSKKRRFVKIELKNDRQCK